MGAYTPQIIVNPKEIILFDFEDTIVFNGNKNKRPQTGKDFHGLTYLPKTDPDRNLYIFSYEKLKSTLEAFNQNNIMCLLTTKRFFDYDPKPSNNCLRILYSRILSPQLLMPCVEYIKHKISLDPMLKNYWESQSSEIIIDGEPSSEKREPNEPAELPKNDFTISDNDLMLPVLNFCQFAEQLGNDKITFVSGNAGSRNFVMKAGYRFVQAQQDEDYLNLAFFNDLLLPNAVAFKNENPQTKLKWEHIRNIPDENYFSQQGNPPNSNKIVIFDFDGAIAYTDPTLIPKRRKPGEDIDAFYGLKNLPRPHTDPKTFVLYPDALHHTLLALHALGVTCILLSKRYYAKSPWPSMSAHHLLYEAKYPDDSYPDPFINKSYLLPFPAYVDYCAKNKNPNLGALWKTLAWPTQTPKPITNHAIIPDQTRTTALSKFPRLQNMVNYAGNMFNFVPETPLNRSNPPESYNENSMEPVLAFCRLANNIKHSDIIFVSGNSKYKDTTERAGYTFIHATPGISGREKSHLYKLLSICEQPYKGKRSIETLKSTTMPQLAFELKTTFLREQILRISQPAMMHKRLCIQDTSPKKIVLWHFSAQDTPLFAANPFPDIPASIWPTDTYNPIKAKLSYAFLELITLLLQQHNILSIFATNNNLNKTFRQHAQGRRMDIPLEVVEKLFNQKSIVPLIDLKCACNRCDEPYSYIDRLLPTYLNTIANADTQKEIQSYESLEDIIVAKSFLRERASNSNDVVFVSDNKNLGNKIANVASNMTFIHTQLSFQFLNELCQHFGISCQTADVNTREVLAELQKLAGMFSS